MDRGGSGIYPHNHTAAVQHEREWAAAAGLRRRLDLADCSVRQAGGAALEHCQPPQEQTRQAVRDMPDDYQPFDATTDRPVTADDSLRADAAAVNASTGKRGC